MQRLSLRLENPFFTCQWHVFSRDLFRSRAPDHTSTLQRLQRKDEKCTVSPQSETPLAVPVLSSLSPDNHSTGTVLANNYEPNSSENINEHAVHKFSEQALFIWKKLLLVAVIKVWNEATIIALVFLHKD